MTKRGRILRDTNAGPGLLTSEGKQYSFVLENMWLSEMPPRPGMPVDISFNADGAPESIVAIPESQVTQEHADQALAGAKRQGQQLAQQAVSRFGTGTLVAFAVLLAAWFLFTTVSIGNGREGVGVTFWRLLGYANEPQAIAVLTNTGAGLSPSAGGYGLLALVALAGPIFPYFWADRRVSLLRALPLAFTALVFFVLREHILSAATSAGVLVGNAAASRAVAMFMQHVSLGLGFYLGLICSIYFAFAGIRTFLSTRS